MSHIFISYSRKNIDFAGRIVKALADNDLDTWVDWKSIPKGEDWWQHIQEGIEEADAFIFLISPDSIVSQVCNDELDHAVQNGKRILPIIIHSPEIEHVPEVLSKLNWIFCRDGQDDFGKAIQEAKETIHTDYEWLKFHTELQIKALKWQRSESEKSLLLRGKELEDAESMLGLKAGLEPQPVDLQREYLLRSRQAVNRQRRQVTIGLGFGIITMAVLAVFAWGQRNSAVAEGDAKATALVNEGYAVATAQAEKERAEEQAKISRSQALGANSQLAKTNPPLSLLLSIEAVNMTADLPNSEITIPRQALRDSLGNIGGIPLSGHVNGVSTLAFSPDGKWLATGNGSLGLPSKNKDATIHLWDMEDIEAKPILLHGHEVGVYALAFSMDNRWLATGGWDNTVRLWDLKNLEKMPIALRGHEGSIYTLAFSPDSHWLATGSSNIIRLWDMQNPLIEPIVMLWHEDSINTTVFSPDSHWLTSGSFDGTIKLLDLKDLQKNPFILSYENNSDPDFITFTSDSRWLATVWNRTTLRFWNLQEIGADPITLLVDARISSIAINPKNNLLATGHEDGSVYLWFEREGNWFKNVTELRGHEDKIAAQTFSPDGHWLATGGWDEITLLWDLQYPASQPIVLKGYEGWLTTLAFSPDGHWLATGGKDSIARLWNLQNIETEPIVLRWQNTNIFAISQDAQWLAAGNYIFGTAQLWNLHNLETEPITLSGHEKSITSLAINSDGRWLATGSEDNTVRLWDIQNPGVEPVALRGPEGEASKIAFSPNNHWLAVGSQDATVRLWDLQNVEMEPIILRKHEYPITSISFDPNDRWLATASEDSTAYLWNLQNIETEPTILEGSEGSFSILAFSPDGLWLATGDYDGVVFLWDLREQNKDPIVLQGHNDQITTLSFSPDGHWLATGSDDTTVNLWDLLIPESDPIILRGHEFGLSALTFSSDGEWLATGSVDGAVRVWDIQNPTAEPLALHGHEWAITTLVFSPDSHRLITGSDFGTVRLWELNTEGLINKACKIVGRNFTRSEWAQYFLNEPYPTKQEDATCPQWPLESEP